MPEIPRAILLPPPQLPQRASVRAVQSESGSAIESVRERRASQVPAQAFLTVTESRREDAAEINGEIKRKHFWFRPYNSRGAADGGAREADLLRTGSEAEAINPEAVDEGMSVDIFEGFGAGARARNSSAFLASFIAQEHVRQGLYNPQFEAASDAYRRAGGSPPAIDNRPRVVSFAI
jgi:hypothetical protein